MVSFLSLKKGPDEKNYTLTHTKDIADEKKEGFQKGTVSGIEKITHLATSKSQRCDPPGPD